MEATKTSPRNSVRGIALPVEHGSWGMLFEPFAASAAVYPSTASLAILCLVLGAFLLRRPLKIGLASAGNPVHTDRRSAAVKFIGAYSALSFAGLAGSLLLSDLYSLAPLLVLVPFGAFQVYNDATGKTRALVPELAGAAAISSVAASTVLAGGAPMRIALSVWMLFALRAIPSILYIRQRLRLEKGKSSSAAIPAVAHGLALIVCAVLAVERLIPYLTLPVFAFLLSRSITGLGERRRRLRAMQIGVREVIYGAALSAAYVAGSYLGI